MNNQIDFIVAILSIVSGILTSFMTIFSVKYIKEPKKRFLLLYMGIPLSAILLGGGFALLYRNKLEIWHAAVLFILIIIYRNVLYYRQRKLLSS